MSLNLKIKTHILLCFSTNGGAPGLELPEHTKKTNPSKPVEYDSYDTDVVADPDHSRYICYSIPKTHLYLLYYILLHYTQILYM